MTPLARACRALRLPGALYLDRGDLPRRDAEIRANLRQQHVAAARLVLALADVLAGPDYAADEVVEDVWHLAATVVKVRDLPASMIGMLAALAMLPEVGDADPDEWGFMVDAAP